MSETGHLSPPGRPSPGFGFRAECRHRFGDWSRLNSAKTGNSSVATHGLSFLKSLATPQETAPVDNERRTCHVAPGVRRKEQKRSVEVGWLPVAAERMGSAVRLSVRARQVLFGHLTRDPARGYGVYSYPARTELER